MYPLRQEDYEVLASLGHAVGIGQNIGLVMGFARMNPRWPLTGSEQLARALRLLSDHEGGAPLSAGATCSGMPGSLREAVSTGASGNVGDEPEERHGSNPGGRMLECSARGPRLTE
jgi:hypothetical protein